VWESKVAPLSGLVAVVLLVVVALIANNYQFMPPAEEVADYYSGDSARIMTAAYVGMLAAFLMLWFSGSVHSALRDIDRRLAVLAFGGGVFASAMMALGYLALLGGAERASLQPPIDPASAALLFDLSGLAVGTGGALGLAALIGAYALVRFQQGASGSGTWISLLIALGLVSPVGWAVIGAGILWVAVVSIQLYREQPVYEPA
jgi:MFS family permease